jgi:hypothetical protein
MPGYVDKLRDIETDAKEGRGIARYEEYWRNNTLSERALKSYTSKQVSAIQVDGEVLYTSSVTKNQFGEWREYIKYREQDLMGNVTWRLLKLAGVSPTGKEASYTEIPSLSSLSFYNPDLTVEESIEYVRATQEEEEKQSMLEAAIAALNAGAVNSLEEAFGGVSDVPAGVLEVDDEALSAYELESGSTIDDALNDALNQLENANESFMLDPAGFDLLESSDSLLDNYSEDLFESENLCES